MIPKHNLIRDIMIWTEQIFHAIYAPYSYFVSSLPWTLANTATLARKINLIFVGAPSNMLLL